MMGRLGQHFILLGIILTLARCTTPSQPQSLSSLHPEKVPKRLMVLVFDQLRPDLIDKYQLKNFLRLRREGLSFSNAIVGHLPSVTVVSHPVITTGLFPNRLPWQDEFFRDDNGKLGDKGLFHSTLDLKAEQFKTLVQETEPVSLLSRLTGSSSRQHSYTIGQKAYAVMGFGAPLQGTVITLGEKMDRPSGWRAPAGFGVPDFFTEPFLGRFYLDCNPTYGSEESLYPLDGNRFAPGSDLAHEGGDAWVRDGVTTLIEKDANWKAIFATFGSIDKVLHILAEHENETKKEWAVKNKLTLRATLERADEALGRILKALEEKNQLEETVIVITADHGGQANTHFHGLTKLGLGTNYLFFAKAKNRENLELPKSLAPILKTREIEAISHDSALRIWTQALSLSRLSDLASEVAKLPGVAEVYRLVNTGNQFHYVRTYRSRNLSGRALQWAISHHPNLLATMANRSAPTIVALLLDNEGYGFLGDHGGAQESVQRVPLILRAPNIQRAHRGISRPDEVRLVDINPMVSYLMKIPVPKGLDGSYRAIEGLME